MMANSVTLYSEEPCSNRRQSSTRLTGVFLLENNVHPSVRLHKEHLCVNICAMCFVFPGVGSCYHPYVMSFSSKTYFRILFFS